jgi:YggT family protein
VGRLLVNIITLYEGLIILRAILSWFTAPHTENRLIEMLNQLTDPILKPVREMLPATNGIDFSPLIVLVGLELVKRVLF